MKLISALIMVLFSLSAFAAEIHLQSGDTVFIRPNVETYVTCEGSSQGSSCTEKVQSFESKMSYCKRSYTSSYCLDNLWPKFKKENSSCVEAAFETCTRHCSSSYTSSYCYTYCQ